MSKHNNDQVTYARCPDCGSERFYQLGDGRRKCRACRKKYSWHSNRFSLQQGFRQQAAWLFWEMVPANSAASLLGANRKTLQRYYGRMPKAIALDQAIKTELGLLTERAVSPGSQGEEMPALPIRALPVFWMLLLPEGLYVIFPRTDLKMDQWRLSRGGALAGGVVFATDRFALERLAIDQFKQKTWWYRSSSVKKDKHLRLERFWAFAKDRLRCYRGGFQGNFPLFVQEMVFRFNQNNPQTALAFLRHSLEIAAETDQNNYMEERGL